MGKAPKKDTFFSKFVQLLPLVTSILMLLTIAFTYYTYFYDVQRVPQIIVTATLDKIEETSDHFILKITVTARNQSKSKVEIVANQGKLYGYNCNLISPDSLSAEDFIKKIKDTVDFINKNYPNSGMEIHKNIDCYSESLIGFFQPFHNDAWLLPEETFTNEIITSVPKEYDMARCYLIMNYSTKRENIKSDYVIDSNRHIDFAIFLADEKDSLKLHKLDYMDDEDREILLKYEIINTGTKSEIWLGSKDTLSNQ